MDKKNLNKIREDHGYTQEYMAEKLGISVAAYCYYERGKRNIPEHTVMLIKEVLNISDADDIFLPVTFAIRKN